MLGKTKQLIDLEEEAKSVSPRCIRLLIDYLLVIETTKAKLFAIRLVRFLPAIAAPAILTKMYRDQDSDVRFSVVQTLSEYRGTKTRQLLIKALKDSDALVRATAAEVIGLLRENSLVNKLFSALKDPSHYVRGCAALAVGQCGRASEIKFLLRFLSREKNVQVRLGLIGALWFLGERSCFSNLLQFLKHSNYQNRCAAANLLSNASSNEAVFARSALQERLKAEKIPAVRFSIRDALSVLRNFEKKASSRKRKREKRSS